MEAAATKAVADAVQQTDPTADIVVFSILIVIIGAISLYEYLSSVRWQGVTSNTRNELVFEEKNKSYGAYYIRNNYNRNLFLIIIGVILFIGLFYGGSIVYSKYSSGPSDQDQEALKQVVIDYYEEPEDKEEEKIEEIPPEKPPVELQDQTAFLPPVVTNEKVDTPPPTISDLEKSNVGKEDVKGNTDYSTQAPPPPTPVVVKHTEPQIETVVDEQAEFPGGRAALVKYLSQHIQYPDIARELGLSGKSVLKFVVNTDGSITQVKIAKGMRDCKECDAAAVKVVQNMPRWTPGKKGGKAVRSYFVLPVVFALE